VPSRSLPHLRRIVFGVLLAGVVAAWSSTPTSAGENALPCEYQGVDRIVAVGDVHGAYDRFIEILRGAGIVDEHLRWAGGRTHLVQTGDVVDRGPDSRKAVDFLEELAKQARRAGGQVHALLGNHEVMRMLGDMRYVSPREYDAFATPHSIEVRRRYVEGLSAEERTKLAAGAAELPLGYVEMREAFGRNGQYGRSLRSHDAVVKVNDVVFLHGGLNPDVAKMSCKDINETVHRELTDDLAKTRAEPLKTLVAGPDGPFWYRGLGEESNGSTPNVDQILESQKAKALVVGHTVQRTGRIQMRFDGKVFAIDTGMQPEYVTGGRASALEIKDGVFTAIYTDQRQILLDPRQASR
jgi:hypothetical protein